MVGFLVPASAILRIPKLVASPGALGPWSNSWQLLRRAALSQVQYLQEGPEKINDDEEKRKLFFQRLNANCSKDHSDLWVDWGISF